MRNLEIKFAEKNIVIISHWVTVQVGTHVNLSAQCYIMLLALAPMRTMIAIVHAILTCGYRALNPVFEIAS